MFNRFFKKQNEKQKKNKNVSRRPKTEKKNVLVYCLHCAFDSLSIIIIAALTTSHASVTTRQTIASHETKRHTKRNFDRHLCDKNEKKMQSTQSKIIVWTRLQSHKLLKIFFFHTFIATFLYFSIFIPNGIL